MTECIVCEHEFSLPHSKPKLKKQYHSTSEDGEDEYMCEGCYFERSQSEFRMIEGVMLCANSKCARNATEHSDYCDVCKDGIYG